MFGMSKVISRTMVVIGLVISIASLLGYYDKFIEGGITYVLDDIITAYRNVVYRVFGYFDFPLSVLAAAIARLFELNRELQPYWKDVIIPTWLYFAALATAAKAEGRTTYRVALFIFGAFLALTLSVLLATQGTELSPAPALATLVVGVLLYELAAYALLMLLVQKDKRAAAPRLGRYVLEKPLTTILMGTCATAMFSLGLSNSESVAALALVFFVFLLAIRDMVLAWFFATENRGQWEGSFTERLQKSKSWKLGCYVAIAIVCATGGIMDLA